MPQFFIKESLRWGWQIWKKNIGFLLLVSLATVVIPGIPSYIADSPRVSGILDTLLTVASWILSLLLSIGVIKITLALVDGQKPTWEELFKHYQLLIRYTIASMLYALIVALGFIALIIPGIYWGLKYQFVVYLIVDKHLSISEAFKRSGEMTKGIKWPLFGWVVIQCVLNLIGLMFFGLGLLITAPVTTLAYAKIYRQLENNHSAQVA